MKITHCNRVGGMFSWHVANFKKKTFFRYIVQFSFKDMWLIPKVEKDYGSLEFDLYGWLFFYFGKDYRALMYEALDGDGDAKLKIVNSGVM